MKAEPNENTRYPTAGIIIIGNEILSGKVEDSNSPYLCKELRFLGVDVKRLVTIPDEINVIGNHVFEYSQDYTWVFTTGGVGPTHDDVTKKAFCKLFSDEMYLDEDYFVILKKKFGRYTKKLI